MLKYDLPQYDNRYFVCIQLQIHDELDKGWDSEIYTLSRMIKERGAVEVHSPFTHLVTHTIHYEDLLAVFPDIDPETLYPVTHFT